MTCYNTYVEIKLCSNNPCKNGGTCSSHEDGLSKCRCELGFTGIHCEINSTKGNYFLVISPSNISYYTYIFITY